MTPRQFETLLRVRRHRRDQVRTALGRILADGRMIEQKAEEVDAVREESVTALRSGTAGGGIDIDRAAAYRFHVLRLAAELTGLRQAAAANGERAGKARALLVRADQGVKAVERLQERFEALRKLEAERRADRDATDRYTSSRALIESRD